MKDVFARLGTDFFSTILFAGVYFATDNIALATAVGIAGAIGQVIYARVTGNSSAS
jgi:intracellular septation protein